MSPSSCLTSTRSNRLATYAACVDVAGFIIGVLGLLFGGHQMRGARKADARLDQANQRLALLQSDVTSIRVVLGPGEKPHVEATESSELRFAAVQYADMDHDGETELLIQHYYGAHGSMLRIYGWTGFDFDQKGQLQTSAPAGFTVGDIDGDGRIEVATVQGDYDRPDPDNPGHTLPYAAGAQVEQLWRIEAGEWSLVGDRRLALPTKQDDKWIRAKYHWHTDPPKIPIPEYEG